MSQEPHLIIKNLEVLTYDRMKLNINIYQSYYIRSVNSVHSRMNNIVTGGLALTSTVSSQQPQGVNLNDYDMIPGEPYADITVNIPQSDALPDNDAYAPVSWESNRNILAALDALNKDNSGCIEITDDTVHYGMNVPATRIIFHPERVTATEKKD